MIGTWIQVCVTKEVAFSKHNYTWFNETKQISIKQGNICCVIPKQLTCDSLTLRKADRNESSQNRLELLEIIIMLWSVMLLSFSTYSQSFEKISTWQILGVNALKTCVENFHSIPAHPSTTLPAKREKSEYLWLIRMFCSDSLSFTDDCNDFQEIICYFGTILLPEILLLIPTKM